MRISIANAAGAAIVALLILSACSREQVPEGHAVVGDTPRQESHAVDPPFVDIAAQVGIDFVHWNGMTGQGYFVEPVGSGGALIDLDNDGDLDVYLVQGRLLSPPGETLKPIFPSPKHGGGRVYRNDLRIDASGRPHLSFTDATEESGLEADGYGMGVAAGDFDNDGRIDLYLTNFGSNQLWRNVSGDGHIRFENVTAKAGVDDPLWSTSASFADLNGDGWLDLFVANYLDFTLENHRACRSPGGRQDYCGPQSYNGEPDHLFLNRRDGTFADITGPAGLAEAASSGLGVVAADFDQDGRIDLYVANDQRRNFLWRNLGNKDGEPHFQNIALESGAAVSMDGRSQASMGVVAGDIDNDGDDDLFMTHLNADTNTLYLNDGRGVFEDRSAATGLGAPSLAYTGFGTALLDLDNDGWLDVVVANGAVRVIEAQARAGDPYPLKQANQLFRNRGDGTFADVSGQAGLEFARLEVSRGIAAGDVDNDGKPDLLLSNNNGPARLLHNASKDGNAWIGLRVLTRSGRDAFGARVAVVRRDGSTLWRRVASDGSYLSASDPRVLVGLGKDPEIHLVRVRWPEGKVETWTGLEAGRFHTLVAGQGEPEP